MLRLRGDGMTIPDLYLWYDAKCGLGHKMRCLALGEEWARRGGKVYESGFPVAGRAVLVFDNYAYEDRSRQLWKNAGHFIVNLEDRLLDVPITCDLLVNYQYGADRDTHYKTNGVQLLGPQYFLMSDTVRDAEWIDGIEWFDADAQNRAMSPKLFSSHLASAKYIKCSAGGTVYQALYFKKPIILRMAAENQKIAYINLIRDGYCLPDTPESVEQIEQHGPYWREAIMQNLVDGIGSVRVAGKILEAYNG